MERRKFLGWIGVGTLATNLPIVLAACSSSNNSASTKISKPKTEDSPNNQADNLSQTSSFVAMGTKQELVDKGLLFSREKKVIVIADKSGKAIAFNPTCNHKGCLVDWDKTQEQFICPCHDSIFTADGTLVSGPATESLPPLNLKLEGDNILVEA